MNSPRYFSAEAHRDGQTTHHSLDGLRARGRACRDEDRQSVGSWGHARLTQQAALAGESLRVRACLYFLLS